MSERTRRIDSPSRRRGWLGPLVALSSIGLAVGLVEIVLWLFFPLPDPYEFVRYASPPNQFIRSEFEPGYRLQTATEPGLPGMGGTKTFSINNLGYRGGELVDPKPPGEYRIFMIGGSTTENLYVDDSESFEAVLEDRLAIDPASGRSVRVYNAGKSGDAIDDHVSMFVHRIVHLEPDLVTVFAGVNDLTRAIYGYDYLHRVQERGGRKLPLLKLLATEFQLPRRILNVIRRFAPTDQQVQERIDRDTDYAAKVALRKSVPPSDDEPVTNLEAFEIYLRTLIGVARAHDIEIVFLTQASSWNSRVDATIADWHWMLYRFGVVYREAAMDAALEAYNDVVREVARQESVPVLDLAKEIPKSSEYFYDDVHFNVAGVARAGRDLADFLVENELVPR